MLQIKNLSKKFNNQIVLNKINYTFGEKGLYYLIGESGCGKTTLINMIARLDKEDSGEIFYNGLNLTKAKLKIVSSYRHSVVGMVFQNFNLVPNLTIKNNFILVNGKNAKRYQTYLNLLNKFKVRELLDSYPYQLSGGEQQRAALARTLAFNYKIILADEPTGSLDKENSSIVMKELVEASKNNLVIVVTHDIKLTNEYSGKIITIEKGSLLGISSKKPYYGSANLTEKKIDPLAILKNSIQSINLRITNYSMLVLVITLILSSLLIVLSGFDGFKDYSYFLSSNRIDSNYFSVYKYIDNKDVKFDVSEINLDYSDISVSLDYEGLFNSYINQIYSLPNNEFFELKIVSYKGNEVIVNSLFDKLLNSDKINLQGSLLVPYLDKNKLSYEKINVDSYLSVDKVIVETSIYNVPKLYLYLEYFLSLFKVNELPLIAKQKNIDNLLFSDYHLNYLDNLGLNGFRLEFTDYHTRKLASDSLLQNSNFYTFFNSSARKDFFQLRLNDEIFETTLNELVESLQLVITILALTLIFTLINIGGLVITYSLRKRKFEFSVLKVFGSTNYELLLNLLAEVSVVAFIIVMSTTLIYLFALGLVRLLIINGNLIDFNYLPLSFQNVSIILFTLMLVLFIGSIESIIAIARINTAQSLKYD
jgi:putative ABC transport system ATP-binding protein